MQLCLHFSIELYGCRGTTLNIHQPVLTGMPTGQYSNDEATAAGNFFYSSTPSAACESCNRYDSVFVAISVVDFTSELVLGRFATQSVPTGCANKKQFPRKNDVIQQVNVHLHIEYSRTTNQILHSFINISNVSIISVRYLRLTLYLNSVHNVSAHQLQQQMIKTFTCACSKCFYIMSASYKRLLPYCMTADCTKFNKILLCTNSQ